ncbi:hypothetical protein [Candidatus Electronema sp. JM]|uniref:hypothetical protein n=1 Tax=Candidatus Electronema sp. JM TaxID=3401571 RepID=UPI003AA9E240
MFSVYGFPKDAERGVWAYGIIRKKREHGLVQLESASLTGYAVQKGFSGGPVFDEEIDKIVGMVATSDQSVRVASMIPIDIISIGYSQVRKALVSNANRQDDANTLSQRERILIIMEYIATHKKTKTFQEQLLTFKEYKVERKWCGLKTVLPNLPKADNEHHVLVMNFKGIYPSIIDILTQEKPETENGLKTNELGQYLFVFIKIKPKLLSIPSPNGGYQLGDWHTINAALDITYQIKDVQEFWLSADDPMAMFQRAVINEARKYFFSVTSEYLIRRPGDSKDDFESYIREHRNSDSETKRSKIF